MYISVNRPNQVMLFNPFARQRIKCEQTDAPNYHPFGTSGTSPAEQAWVPEASGSW